MRWIWRTVGGRGPDSNLELTTVYTVRKGRMILGLEHFWDHAEALETLGLQE